MSVRGVLIVLVAGVVAAVLAVPRLRAVFSTGGAERDEERLGDDPASREFGALYGRTLADDPAWRDVLRSATGPADAQERVRQLTAWGVVRLDDEALRARASVLRSILAGDAALCASIARGKATTAMLSPALMRLDPVARRLWFDVGAKAMLAELHKTPAPELRQEDVAEAFQALITPLLPDQVLRLRAVTGHGEGASDDDACWAIRTLYERAAALPEAQQMIVLRMLAKNS